MHVVIHIPIKVNMRQKQHKIEKLLYQWLATEPASKEHKDKHQTQPGEGYLAWRLRSPAGAACENLGQELAATPNYVKR